MTVMEVKNFGYAPDPPKALGDKPDLHFSDLRPQLQAILPGDVDLRGYTTPTNQYNLPSCVGNATADAIEVLSAAQGHPKVELSRLFIWSMARALMAEKGYKEKTGTYIRLAFQVLNQFGVCLEQYWPYDESQWDKLPSFLAMRKATGRKIKGYHRIDSEGASRAEDILSALRANHPVVFGTQLDNQWGSYRGGILHRPKGATIGGHAMVCVGYDSSKGFIVKNSWGSGWGEQGFCYLSEDYMTWDKTWDIWVPTIGRDFK